MTETFSVATPVLNGMPLLRRCIGSVRGQEGVEVEHVVKDGGSSDGTLEWLAEQTQDLVVHTGPDSGLYDAVQQAWSVANGSVLSWLNVDEQYLPGTLKVVDRMFSDLPDADVIAGNVIIVNATGMPIAARREIPLRRNYVRNGFLYTLSCALFFRRRLLDSGLLQFDPDLRIAGDLDLVLKLLEADCVIVRTPHYLSLFGIDGENLSLQSRASEEVEAVRQRHGALHPRLRRLILTGRFAEKLLTGCYRKEVLNYLYATDEIPTYLTVRRHDVPSTFSWGEVAKTRSEP